MPTSARCGIWSIARHEDDVEKEIALWFKSEELLNYKLMNEAILYDVDLNRIPESGESLTFRLVIICSYSCQTLCPERPVCSF